MRSIDLLLLSAVALHPGCGRVDEPAPARPAVVPRLEQRSPSMTHSAVNARGVPASETTKPCIVETPTEPPPMARPATRCPPDPGGAPTLARGSVTFVNAPERPEVSVELALEPPHRARGLMYRTRMPANDGMLFSWTEAEVQTFWMRNTCIPLDMLFIAKDGTVAGILEQVPTMNDAPRAVPCPVRYVLEVNAGWTRKHRVRAGQKVVIRP